MIYIIVMVLKIILLLWLLLLLLLLLLFLLNWETYTRHLNHETNCKCSKALQKITNQ
jgi:predicted negative regulator of RcsB-dependent stress response